MTSVPFVEMICHSPITTLTKKTPIDRIFYGRINVKKASSFLFFTENGIVKQLIHHLKYKSQEQIGTFLGDWYGQILKSDKALGVIDAVVPVPLHKKKLKKRGYNQVEKFGQRVAFHLNTEYVDGILVKTADTKTQTTKGRLGRWQGDKALYTLADSHYFKNKNVLLVDDVITSGATMEIAAKALLETEGISVQMTSMAVVAQFQ